ncbi:MAG TPA: hypothetical protein VEA63_16465, partial [Opitutus sp.]|nr:hypothetical protein [Opitutus sp.]
AVVASADAPAPSPALTPEVIEHYEDRAAGGDAIAAAILTEIYGRSANTRDKALAFDYAYAAYGSGQPVGGAALGSAFSNGYGVEKDAALGDALLKQSGLDELLGAVLVGVAAREAFVRTDNSAGKVNAAIVMGTTAVGILNTIAQNQATDRFSRDPIRQTRYRLNEMREDLTKRRPDNAGAVEHLAKLRNTLTAAAELPESHKAYLLERVSALETALASSPPDRNAALTIIEEIVPSRKAAATAQATSS